MRVPQGAGFAGRVVPFRALKHIMDRHSQHMGACASCVVTPILPSVPIRQFEFGLAPEVAQYAAAGSPLGCAMLIRHGGTAGGAPARPALIGAVRRFGKARRDQVLGVCWLRRHAYRFVRRVSLSRRDRIFRRAHQAAR